MHEEIKPVDIAIIELCLSESISYSVNQSVSIKFCEIKEIKTSYLLNGRVYGWSEDIFGLGMTY